MQDFVDDWPAALDSAGEAGIDHVIVVGIDLESSKQAIAMADQHGRLLATVGVHPHDVSSINDSIIDELRLLAGHPKVVAVGETGLDFYRNRSPRDKQIEAFEMQLALAEELRLPVVVHDRDAHEQVAEILSGRAPNLAGGVLHCFSGDVALAEAAIDWGFYISIAGPVTYPNAGDLRSVAEHIPIEKLVIETDAPYLAPQPKRGKRNEPAYVRYVAEELATLKGLSVEDIDRITTLNARRLFGFPLEENGDVIVYPIRNSLYINVTGSCTNECTFCTKYKSPYVKGYNLSLRSDPTAEEIIGALAQKGNRSFDEVVFCGLGEPFLRLDVIKEVAGHLKKGGQKVRINTNGQANLIHGRNVLPELEGLIDSLSVSLNSSNAEDYFDLCRPRFGRETFNAVLDFIRESKKYIPDVSVTALDFDHEEFEACRKLSVEQLGVGFRERYYNEVG
jgi:TatD DNase family protein